MMLLKLHYCVCDRKHAVGDAADSSVSQMEPVTGRLSKAQAVRPSTVDTLQQDAAGKSVSKPVTRNSSSQRMTRSASPLNTPSGSQLVGKSCSVW